MTAPAPHAYRTPGGHIIWQDDTGRWHQGNDADPMIATADHMENLAAQSTPLYLSEQP